MSNQESRKSSKSSGGGEVYDRNINFRKTDDNQMAASYTEISFQTKNSRNCMKNIDNADPINEDANVSGNKAHASGRDTYFEESIGGGKHPKRPVTLMCDRVFPYDLDGTVRREGEMTHFVAENLEYKLKLSSPITKREMSSGNSLSKNSTPSMSAGLSQRHFFQSQLVQIDSNVLSDIEIDAQYLAASVDNLTENLYNLLRSISSITADNVEIHKNSVNKLTDNMDANIKCMYTIMAKTEEISKSMKPTEQLALRIREIKRLVDMLENNI